MSLPEASPTLLTVEQLREHILDTAVVDDVLVQVLVQNELAIVRRYGPVAEAIEVLHGQGLTLLWLPHPGSTIAEVKEVDGATTVTLGDDDWSREGNWLRRRAYGTHPRAGWGERVEVTHTPGDDTAERIRVLVALCKLDLNHNPGMTSDSAGPVTEQYAANSVFNYAIERESILATLDEPEAFFA